MSKSSRKYNPNKRKGSKRPTMKDIGQGKYKRLSKRECAVRKLNRESYFKAKALE